MIDRATGLPLVTCDECGCEIVGFSGDDESECLCEDCYKEKYEVVIK